MYYTAYIDIDIDLLYNTLYFNISYGCHLLDEEIKSV